MMFDPPAHGKASFLFALVSSVFYRLARYPAFCFKIRPAGTLRRRVARLGQQRHPGRWKSCSGEFSCGAREDKFPI